MTEEKNVPITNITKNPEEDTIKSTPIDPNDQSTLLQQYRDISDHAHKEIESIYTLFKLLLAIGTFVLTVILGFGTYSIRSYINQTREDLKILKMKLELE